MDGRNTDTVSSSDASGKRGSTERAPGEQQEGEGVTRSGDVPENSSAWDGFMQRIGTAKDTYISANWSERIKNYVAPSWTSLLPDTLQTLQRELSMDSGSLADEVWQDSHNATLNPEISRSATVRIGEDLCRDERAFRQRRRAAMVKHLASYLGLKEQDIHPDDVPVISICSSGGGLRALVAGTGSYLAAKEAGLWDCTMYTAGVSGSCWLQTIYNSSLGGQDFHKVANHLRERLGVHFAFPPQALDMLTSPPTNKYLLRGLVEKLKGDPGADFGLVDIYGLLLSSRLLVSADEANTRDGDLKMSNQRSVVHSGDHPLPIYTAVRHEIPTEHAEQPSSEPDDALKEQAKTESWFQWFEFTPYEFFCEELAAGIPTWALGRHFKDGESLAPQNGCSVPELRIPALMGLWASAFCATLAHYYREIRPALTGLAGFGGIDSLIEGKNDDLSRVHPIDPATIPNFVLGLQGKLPASCPRSIFEHSHFRLMDAGMSNNLPIYPLLRSGRDVDLIVTFDASADIKVDNWLSAVDGYAIQRGIHGWPLGSGWPRSGTKPEDTAAVLRRHPHNVDGKDPPPQAARSPNAESDESTDPSDLGYCNIWLGSAEERTSTTEPPPTKRLFHPPEADHSASDFHLTRSDAGTALAYFPLLSNPAAPRLGGSHAVSPTPENNTESKTRSSKTDQPEHPRAVDPTKDDFMSTWNFVYTPEQVDALVGLARTNFAEGEGQVKRVVRGIYERKKRARLERENEQANEESNPFC